MSLIKNKFPLSKITILYLVLIPICSLFFRQVYDLILTSVDRDVIEQLLWGILIFMALATLLFCRSSITTKKINYLGLTCVFLFATIIYLNLDLPEERFHLLEFGLLGFLLSRDLVHKYFYWPIILGSLWGGFDELVQALLPYRVGDIRDLILNLLCVIWGVVAHRVIFK